MLGVPVGQSTFVQKWLADKESHQQFLTRVPAVQDVRWAQTTSSVICPRPNCHSSPKAMTPVGLGLRSATRLAPAANWASWADCLSQVHARAPQVCTQLLQELEGPPSRAQCVREAQDAAAMLAGEGVEVPDWSRFTAPEFRAPQPVDLEVGEWIHGWQLHASVARDSFWQLACTCHRCRRITKS